MDRSRGLVGAALLTVAVVALAGAPIVELAKSALVAGGRLTLEPFRQASAVEGWSRLVGTTVVFALGATAIAVVLGGALAIAVARTDVGGRRVLLVAAVAPLVVPGVVYALAWLALAGPRAGLANRAFHATLGARPFDVFGFAGMTVVEGLHLVPLALLLVLIGLADLDPVLEDLAASSGARPATLLRRVTVPLTRRAIAGAALLLCVSALDGFEIPALLGVPGDRWVLATRVWRAMAVYQGGPARAGAYALVLLALTGLALIAHRAVTGGRRGAAPITGWAAPRRPMALRGWRAPATAAAWTAVLLTGLAPLAALGWTSLEATFGSGNMTAANYTAILHDGAIGSAVRTTVVLAVAAATAAAGAGAAIGWMLRRRPRAGALVGAVATAPLAVPGVVLGSALATLWLGIPLAVYGTLWILLIAALVRGLPLAATFGSVAVGRVPSDLEDLARVSGATPAVASRRVVLPLALPGLVGAWVVVAAMTARELGSIVLLAPPGEQTVALRIWDAYTDGRFGQAAALGVLLVAALLVLGAVAVRLAPAGGRR